MRRRARVAGKKSWNLFELQVVRQSTVARGNRQTTQISEDLETNTVPKTIVIVIVGEPNCSTEHMQGDDICQDVTSIIGEARLGTTIRTRITRRPRR